LLELENKRRKASLTTKKEQLDQVEEELKERKNRLKEKARRVGRDLVRKLVKEETVFC